MRPKSAIIIKGAEFVRDFRSLNSSLAEITKALAKAGLSAGTLYNWETRSQETGVARVAGDSFKALCDISGLSYEDYYVGPATYPRKHPAKTVHKNVNSKRLDNGVVVTTYSSIEMEKGVNKPTSAAVAHLKIKNFRDHVEVYRKLLGLSTAMLVNDYHIENYPDIEAGKNTLSVSTYFKLCEIFMTEYNRLSDGALKNAFKELATSYQDICIKIIYFGDK